MNSIFTITIIFFCIIISLSLLTINISITIIILRLEAATRHEELRELCDDYGLSNIPFHGDDEEEDEKEDDDNDTVGDQSNHCILNKKTTKFHGETQKEARKQGAGSQSCKLKTATQDHSNQSNIHIKQQNLNSQSNNNNNSEDNKGIDEKVIVPTKIEKDQTKYRETPEFFFDRHPRPFKSILNFYRTGKLQFVSEVSDQMSTKIVDFFSMFYILKKLKNDWKRMNMIFLKIPIEKIIAMTVV